MFPQTLTSFLANQFLVTDSISSSVESQPASNEMGLSVVSYRERSFKLCGVWLPYSLQSPPFIMISGDVHGPVTNMGNYNSGVIAGSIGTLVQSNKSE